MVREFSRIAVARLAADTGDPREVVYPRKFAFDPRKSASWLSRLVISERRTQMLSG